MNLPILLLVLPYSVISILINGKSDQKSLVLSLDSDTSNIVPNPESRSQVRNKRMTSNVELIAFKVESNIRYRYSRTHVTSHVRNKDDKSQEVTFQVILPETAFISKFTMEIDDRKYEAYVKEKEEAKEDYRRAQSRGQSAGLLELNARHANVFNVNVNIQANSIVSFNLTYEELLSRRFGRYEQVITMNGDEISKNNDVQVVVRIEESQPLATVKALNLQNELEASETGTSDAKITNPAPNRAQITWKPASKKETLKRFVIQYDVKRELDSGEVLIMNGYFVHFFAPPKLKPLQKHVVFVLDVSGSMAGRKIAQLKEAMVEILNDLNSNDYLNMIIFSTDVTAWTPGAKYDAPSWNVGRAAGRHANSFPSQPFPANAKNIKDAKMYIENLVASGSTNINDAVIQALNLTARIRQAREDYAEKERNTRVARDTMKVQMTVEVLPPRAESLILFLTDGEPTIGVTDLAQIQKNIELANLGIRIPLFSLAFGSGADFTFLRKLSLQNHAFARKIYEAADAALQLQGFYAEISSPLLSNVEFNYTSTDSPYTISEVTRRRFPTFFDGWELAVAGKIEPSSKSYETEGKSDDEFPTSSKSIRSLIRYEPTDHCHFYTSVNGMGHDGVHHWARPMMYVRHPPWWCYPRPPPTTTTTVRPDASAEDSFLERLWAYLTIQNLIEKDMAGTEGPGGEPGKQKSLRLALKYGFVTSQTSLVVVKPESKDVTNAESTDEFRRDQGGGGGSGGGGRLMNFAAAGGAAGGSRHGSFSKGFSAPRPLMRSESADAASYDDEPMAMKKTVSTRRQEKAPVAMKRQKNEFATTSGPFTLSDLKWLNGDIIKITPKEGGGEKEYRVAKSGKEISNSLPGFECEIRNRGSKLNKVTGRCEHLKNCIREEFTDDFDAYRDFYFCPIESTSDSKVYYAGACCA